MPATPEELLLFLNELKIETTTHHHPPLKTVEESKALRGDLSGLHCKNLFLKDKKGVLWLVVAREDAIINMKDLRHKIGSHGLSFGKPDLLMQILGVIPGSVTPFALANDRNHQVRVVLDQFMMNESLVNYHPLSNEMTTALSPAGLRRFITACGHDFSEVEL